MKRRFIAYNPEIKALARKLRNHSTVAEIILWQQLKGQNTFGYDFHRQRPLDRYIVDFFCPELMLAIEIDGITHVGLEAEDRLRQEILESLGVKFLRFQDHDVRDDLAGVMIAISAWIDKHTPSPTPKNGA